MKRLFPAFALFPLFHSFLAGAQDAAPAAPVETVSMVWVAIFGAIFLGSIVWFFIYLNYKERKSKQGAPGK